MSKKEKFTPEQVIDAIKAANGLLGYAAKTLGCDYSTVWNYSKRYKSVAAAIKNEKESLLDLSENKLYHAIKNGEAWAICFHLKTQGKERGYSERHEVTGKDGKDLPASPTAGAVIFDAATLQGALAALVESGAVKVSGG